MTQIKYNLTITNFKKAVIRFLAVITSIFLFILLIVGYFIPTVQESSFILTFLLTITYILGYAAYNDFKDKKLLQIAILKQNNITYNDKQKIALYGKIKSLGDNIVSPFTKTNCVYYCYGIYNWIWRRRGKSSSKEKDYKYEGNHLTESSIDIGYKQIPFYSVPVFKNFKKSVFKYDSNNLNIYSNAKEYIQNTVFTKISSGLSQVKQISNIAKDNILDIDRNIKNDMEYEDKDFLLEQFELEEEIVMDREDVCVIGVWDSARNGLITYNNVSHLTVYKGDPNIVLSAMNKQMTGILILASIFFLMAVILVFINAYDYYKWDISEFETIYKYLISF